MKVVVAGGSGFLGGALVRAFRKESHEVTVLTRRLPGGPGEVPWDPRDASGEWAKTLRGADAVINLAGEPIADKRWTPARKAAILQSRLDATGTLVEAIRSASPAPATFLSGSAIGFYGTRGDERLDETSPAGSDFLARVCREWEARALGASGACRVVLLRTGLVLGKGGGALPQLALPFRLFAGGRLGSGRQYMSWIHRRDWVALVAWALVTPDVAGPLNLTAPEPVTNAEMAAALGQVLKRPSLLPAPAFALRLVLGEMADAMILGGQRVMPAVAGRAGFTFRYPRLDAALREIYTAPDESD